MDCAFVYYANTFLIPCGEPALEGDSLCKYHTLPVIAAVNDETRDDRPKCGYNISPDPNSPTPCGSEKELNRVTVRSGESPGIVCGDHRVKVWTHHDVVSIEPLDRTTK